MSLVGLAVVTILLLVWYFWNRNSQPPVVPPKIASFTVSPAAIPANSEAQLCYKVENADRVRIEPNIGERKLASNECLSVTPSETLTYTLTAYAADGTTTSQNVTLNVGPLPALADATKPASPSPTVVVEEPKLKHAQILFFKVSSSRIQRGAPVELCYGVADAQTTTISPLGKEVPSVAQNCFNHTPRESMTYTLSTRGEDNQTSTATQTVEVEKLVTPPVKITRFEINLTKVHGTQLCYALENARSARIEPGIGELQNLTAGCPRLPSLKQQTYTLTVTGFDGNTITDTETYTPPDRPDVQLPAMKISSFTPERQTIKPGAQATICYRTTFGEGTAEISPQPGSVPAAVFARNCVTVAPKETTVYRLTVGRGNEKDSRKVTVIVDKGGPVIF
jgi:hypothetical protein